METSVYILSKTDEEHLFSPGAGALYCTTVLFECICKGTRILYYFW